MKYKLFILLSGLAVSLFAQEQERISDLEKERQNILTEIEETTQLLDANKSTISNALNRLILLNSNIEYRKKMISSLNRELSGIDHGIVDREIQIKVLEMRLQEKKDNYAAAVRKMYIYRNRLNNNLLFILSAENFTQSLHRIMYLKEYYKWQKRQASEIIEKQKKVNTEKLILLNSKEIKQTLLAGRTSEEDRLNEEILSKNEEIQLLERNKKKLLSELERKKRQAEALNQRIEGIIAEETSMSASSRNEAQEERQAEIKGGYAMTAVEKALSSSFADNKGRLPFPLSGNYKIVNYFGIHQYKELSKVSVNCNGIEMETTPDNEARAVFDGVVSRIFVLPGYHNSIIVRHGNYLTLYSNIDQVYVKQGSRVNTGQTLGKIYTDRENGNSTLLHFELWKERTKLDPLPWLNR
ncbi:MAG: peptidoglycan DD-metalloendopeptidase family protein [Dysgonamonadaceae bacterium]|jgi:septal ring factor EnvC (AmiA/AmiB activator)|nr:peptidoglycan DD-metalloendopeptidase family protein [Dysgonamonadaceae bacterium]